MNLFLLCFYTLNGIDVSVLGEGSLRLLLVDLVGSFVGGHIGREIYFLVDSYLFVLSWL